MVPGVVELRAKLRIPAVVDRRLLGNDQIGITNRRSTAQGVRNVAEDTGPWIGNIGRVKPIGVVGLGILKLDWTRSLRSVGILEKETAHQLGIVLGLHANREARLIRDNRRSAPTIESLAPEAVVLGNGKVPHWTEDKAVLGAEKRIATRGVEVDRVELLFEGRTLIDGLAECVGPLEQQAVGIAAFERDLQTVIV